MARIPQIKKHQVESVIKKTLSTKSSVTDLQDDDSFKLSLKHIDRQQGQSFYDWQAQGILADALETITNLCSQSIHSQLSKTFTIYGNFPPSEKTEFTHPAHVPEDAEWSRIHVNGTHCLIGHIVKNTFYLVFLDANHRFWISELKHT